MKGLQRYRKKNIWVCGKNSILLFMFARMVMFLLFGRSEIAIRDLEKLFTEEKSETILEFLADLKIIIPRLV